MSFLHTVNLLPGQPACEDCLALLVPGDTVLFHGDGAWLARRDAVWLPRWAASGAGLYVLGADLDACGLEGLCDPRVEPVDAAGFLSLTETHSPQRAWY